MNDKIIKTNTSTSVARRWALACALLGFLPGMGRADLWNTQWDITGVSRIDVTPIRAPGMIAEHTVDVFDDLYSFKANGDFPLPSLAVTPVWKQTTSRGKSQYAITFDIYDAMDLEANYRAKLEDNDPNIFVNQVKLVSRKLVGSELDNGIWGTEKYEYKVDTTLNGVRDVVRVVQFVQVAGVEHVVTPAGAFIAKTLSTQAAGSEPRRRDAMDAAASAVVQYMRKRSEAAH